MERKTVLVTGIGGNVGQGVLRNINSMNLDIKIIGTDVAAFTPGNYLCDFTYVVPYSYDENYISSIQDIVQQEKVDLIIPTTDYEIYYLSLNQSAISAKIVASDAEIAKKYLDKYLTYLHHQELGIPFAQSWLPNEYDQSCQNIILKPREGRGSRGIVINPENLQKFGDDYMVQPLYEGKEITTAFYVKKDGTLHGLFTMERELSHGTTSKSKTNKNFDGELKKIIQKMIDYGGLRGSVNIQSIVDSEGNITPFEVNCRISGTNSIRHNLGFQDVKYTIQEYLLHELPDAVCAIEGIATRILLDVVYPQAIDEQDLNNKKSTHIVY